MNDNTPPALKKHERIAKRVEDISMSVGILATVVGIAAAAAEPSGISAFAVFIGLSDPPMVVTLAPIITNIATGFALISGACFIYAKWKG